MPPRLKSPRYDWAVMFRGVGKVLYDPTTRRLKIVPVGKFSIQAGGGAPAKPKAVDLALSEIVALLQPPSPPQNVKTLTSLLRARGFTFHENTVRQSVLLGVGTGVLKVGGPRNSPTYAVP
jgi:hypothetical protein